MSNMEVLYVISDACGAGGNCVEAGLLPTGEVSVRDSKDRQREPQIYTPEEWDAFIVGVKSGQFDRTALPTPVG